MKAILLALLALLGLTTLGVAGGYVVLLADRGRPLRFSIPALAAAVREVVVQAVFLLVSPLGIFRTGPRAPPEDLEQDGGSRPPVLLLPGYGDGRVVMLPLAFFLHRRGWPCTWTAGHRPFSAPIPELARRLDEVVDTLRAVSGQERVDVVAHSMGGLVVAWYAGHLDGGRKIRRLVALGTPWHGTRNAVFGWRRQARDMLPGAAFISSLGPPVLPTTAIWSRTDEVVVPSESALPLPGPGVRSVEVPHCGHKSLLASARVFQLVAQALDR